MSSSNIESLRDRAELVYDRFRPQHVNDLPAGFLDEVKKTFQRCSLKEHSLERFIDLELYAMHAVWARLWSKGVDSLTGKSRAQELLEGFDLCLTPEDGLWGTESGALKWSIKCFRDQEDPETNTYKELDILKKLFDDPEIRKRIGESFNYLSLVDLGAGNGEKAKVMIERLTDVVVCYYPVDKGMYMNAVALANIASLGKRKDCVLHDNNWYFYRYAKTFAQTKNAEISALLEKVEIVRERYETIIGRLEDLINHPSYEEYKKKGFHRRWMFYPKDGELTREQFISQQLSSLNEIHNYVVKAIESKDKRKLRQLYVLSEILDVFFSTRTRSEDFSAFYYSNPADYIFIQNDHIDTDLFMDPNLALTLQLMTGTHPFKLFDEELFNMFRYVLDLNEMYNLLFGNRKGKIQFTAPSVGICANFDNIDEVIETLDCTNFIDKDPRLVMLLGQTLGNFDYAGRIEFCQKIYDSLSQGDMFLVGVELRPEDNDPLYDQEIERIKRNYLKDEEFARECLSEHDRIDDTLSFDVGYDRTSNDIVIKFTSPKRAIDVTNSHKFSVSELEELLTKDVPFEIIGRDFYKGKERRFNDRLYDTVKEYAVYLVRK